MARREVPMDVVSMRLAKLERSAARWRWASVALGAALIGGMVAGAGPGVPEKVEARRFVAVGADGKVRAEFGCNRHEQPHVILYDDSGSERFVATLSTSRAGGEAPRLSFMDGKRAVRAEVELDGRGTPLIRPR
jgi:hypothetical protein